MTGPCRRACLAIAAVLAFGAAAAGCASSGSPEDGDTDGAGAAPGAQATPPDAAAAALAGEAEALTAAVATARDALLEAAGAQELTAARAAATAAATQLVADAPLAEGEEPPDPPAVMPGPLSSRTREEQIDYGDAFTRTMSAARAAGQAGAPVLGVLRDPLAGDLGTWQRDPAGVLASIDEVVDTASVPEEAEAAVAELPGEISKAIVFARLAAQADTLPTVQAYADRGAAHLDIIDTALSDLELPGGG